MMAPRHRRPGRRPPLATITKTDDQFTYFMGASRAKQTLAVPRKG